MLINLKTFLNEPKWMNRVILYMSLFGILVLVLHYVFLKSELIHTDFESARYMLSALVQSEAAIVALVITLTLVVVQLASTSYSTRVIEVFTKTTDLWILLLIYGIAIFYGLLVIKQIDEANSQIYYLYYIERHIALSYYLGVFAYVSLIPYTLNTLNLLSPSMIIKILSEKVEGYKNIKIKKIENYDGYKNPIQSIVDIINCSLDKNDHETSKIGLNAMDKCMKYICTTISENEREKASIIFIRHFKRIGNYAIGNSIKQPTSITINILYKKGCVAIKEKQTDAVFWSIWSLGTIGAEIEKQEIFTNLSFKSVCYINELGKHACDEQLEEATWWAIYSLEKIGQIAAKNQNEFMVLTILNYLEEIKNATNKKGLVIANQRSDFSISTIETGFHDYNAAIMKEEQLKLKELLEHFNEMREKDFDYS